MVVCCCIHYREKIITRLPAGNVRHAIPEYQEYIAARSNFQFNVMGKVKVKVNMLVLLMNTTRLILWQNRSVLCFEHGIRLYDKRARSVLHCRLNLQFDMLDFNTGFALVVRLVNTIFPKKLPDGTFSSI